MALRILIASSLFVAAPASRLAVLGKEQQLVAEESEESEGYSLNQTSMSAAKVEDQHRGVRRCDKSGKASNVPAEVARKFAKIDYLSAGATACLFLGDGKVAIKTSKFNGRLGMWKRECQKQQTLHKAACGKGAKMQEDVVTYLPACTAVGGTYEHPWLTMHAVAHAKLISSIAKRLPVDYQKSVYAQLVAAIRTMHALGWSHNDLHDRNIVVNVPSSLLKSHNRHDPPPPPINEATRIPRLALIDFGDVTPLARANMRSYKRDANAIWSHGATLVGCDRSRSRDGARNLLDCMSKKWGVDEEFKAALMIMIKASLNHDRNQKVEQLYQTAWVQSHLPSAKRLYPSDVCKNSTAEK